MHHLNDKLNSGHINEILRTTHDDNHSRVLKYLSNKLEPLHIHTLIKNGDSKVHEQMLSMLPDKLEPSHLSELIKNGDPKVHETLLTQMGDKLEQTHMNKLSQDNIYSKLSKRAKRKLEHHITVMKYRNYKKSLNEEKYLANGNFQKLLKESLISKTNAF